jgi:hypothetical protein
MYIPMANMSIPFIARQIQALVAAAHLARQCGDGSEGLAPGIKEETLRAPAAVHDVERAAEEMWRLYQIARQV